MITPIGWSILRHRDFAIVCGARFAVTLALQMTGVAIGWYIYDVTGSAFALAYLGLAGLLPALTLVLITGYVADRVDRRLVMFASDIMLTLTGLALWWLVARGQGIIWPIYIIIILVSASRAFHNPAAQAIIPALVPQEQLSTAIAFASSMFQFAQILGLVAVGDVTADWIEEFALHRDEPSVDLPDDVGTGDLHVGEEQLGGVGLLLPHLVELAAPFKAGHATLNPEERDPLGALVRRSPCGHDDEVRLVSVGDERL